MEAKDYLSLLISGVSLLASLYTFWLVQFNRGRLEMTRPTYICMRRDEATNWPKIFVRTCLYSTGAKGLLVESIYLKVHRDDGTEYLFDFWGHTEARRLTIGSGLFVGQTGTANDHHFNHRGPLESFIYAAGVYRIEILAKVVGKSARKLSEIECTITGEQSADLVQRLHGQIDFYLDNDRNEYIGVIRCDRTIPRSYATSY